MARTEPEWKLVSRGSATRVEFDKDGDVFTGVFEGTVDVTNEATGEVYDYLEFTGDDGELYQISASYQLSRTFRNIPPGTYCRITRKREIPMGNTKNPMKDYRVETQAR